MASVPRSERILNALAARAGISECGKNWLIQALDPFHDTQLNPCGYPDTTASASVVQRVKNSYQVSCPAGLTTGTWDVNCALMPWLNPVQFVSGSSTMNGSTTTNVLTQVNDSVTLNVGGLQTIAAASGGNLNIGSVNNSSNTAYNTSNTIPSLYLAGTGRVVGYAMEIVNTTSELNKQGLATMYRIPIPQNDDGSTVTLDAKYTGDSINFVGSASAIFMPMPPQNIAAAQLFAGTKAWDAQKGSYNVAPFNTPDVPAQSLSYITPILYNTAATDSTVFAPTFARNTTITGFGAASVPSFYWTEMDMVGTYFTGLSIQTSLTVNVIVYIERFPTQDDLDLLVIAQRSPEYDIKALEAYSLIAQSLPVAVPFDENGLGDWFKGAVNMASEYLVPALSGLGAYGKLGAAAITAGKYAMDQFDQPASDTKVTVVNEIPRAPPSGGKSYAPKNRGLRQMTKSAKTGKVRISSKISRDSALRNELAAVKKTLKKVKR